MIGSAVVVCIENISLESHTSSYKALQASVVHILGFPMGVSVSVYHLRMFHYLLAEVHPG